MQMIEADWEVVSGIRCDGSESCTNTLCGFAWKRETPSATCSRDHFWFSAKMSPIPWLCWIHVSQQIFRFCQWTNEPVTEENLRHVVSMVVVKCTAQLIRNRLQQDDCIFQGNWPWVRKHDGDITQRSVPKDGIHSESCNKCFQVCKLPSQNSLHIHVQQTGVGKLIQSQMYKKVLQWSCSSDDKIYIQRFIVLLCAGNIVERARWPIQRFTSRQFWHSTIGSKSRVYGSTSVLLETSGNWRQIKSFGGCLLPCTKKSRC